MVVNLPSFSKAQEPCEACMMGKQQRKAFPQETSNHAKAPLQLVHADLSGKAPTQALGGCNYYMLIVDDYSRYMWVYFLWDKAEALGKFKQWQRIVENESGMKVQKLQIDQFE
eukprot:c13868_g1_i1 orf=131-469(+)